ncbi:hypothetical protein HF313_09780 [Massilia atriviolacea]|uniref:Uncharacterized protein n=1 Tax=Massilia atriviolacea TaxID=2495579 RepID=A0A430HF63_9BURK|nr:hypothetical protein [Massilia atriviolacea]RSZ56151.1 hypothetical protein EJB06_26295 [Massilia atriviolacea]
MTLANKVAQFYVDADVVHDIAHGDANTTVDTLGGPVPSLAKLTKDLAASFPLAGPRYLQVREVQPSGMGATTGTASEPNTPIQRILNTVVTNEIAGASLANNAITLPPGKYYFRARSPGNAFGRIASMSGTPFVLYGKSAMTGGLNACDHETVGMATLSAQTQVAIYTVIGEGSVPLGGGKVAEVQVISELEIWKL